jgi:hypothetical protein
MPTTHRRRVQPPRRLQQQQCTATETTCTLSHRPTGSITPMGATTRAQPTARTLLLALAVEALHFRRVFFPNIWPPASPDPARPARPSSVYGGESFLDPSDVPYLSFWVFFSLFLYVYARSHLHIALHPRFRLSIIARCSPLAHRICYQPSNLFMQSI